jgi:hypothetical protein
MIVSTSHKNARNHSQYARRRSIRKGNREQLVAVVTELKNRQSLVVCEEFSPSRMHRYTRPNVLEAFAVNWGLADTGLKMGKVLAHRTVSFDPKKCQYQPRIDRIPNPELKSDFRLILADLSLLVDQRGFASAPHAYLAVFVGTNWLDVIASKWGNTAGHHFFHWQGVAAGAPAAVNTVDDGSAEDDASLGEDAD